MKMTIALAGLAMAGGLVSAKEITATVNIPGMDCAACTVAIKHALARTKGVKRVDLNVDTRLARIVYEDTQVTPTQIEAAIEKSGFQVKPSK